jgi:hypothetical protein
MSTRQSKSGKARHVVLTDEGMAFFADLAAGRSSGEIMLLKDDVCDTPGRAMRS